MAVPTALSRRAARWVAVAVGLAAGGAAALCLAAPPAGAEASTTTATLSLTGVVDSNCPVATGGSTVYVAPGGTVDFKATLVGLSLNLPLVGHLPLNSTTLASFSYTLVVDHDAKHPHAVTATTDYKLTGVPAGQHTIQWSATSVQLLPGIAPLLPLNVPLNASNTILPAGAKLAWAGTVNATSATAKCGIAAQLPSAHVSVGPVQVGIPSVPLPTLPVTLPTALPTGAPHTPTPTPSPTHSSAGVPPLSYVPPGESNQDRVMPPGYDNNGASTDSGLGPNSDLTRLLNPHGAGFGVSPNGPAPDNGAPVGSAVDGKATKARAVDLATSDPSAGQQMPVLLAIIAIIALSLVTATYARLYLLRRNL